MQNSEIDPSYPLSRNLFAGSRVAPIRGTAMTSNQPQLISPVAKIVLLVTFVLITPVLAAAQVYTVLTFDGKGDGRDPALADAAQLAYRYDQQQDVLWFRIA